MTDVSADERRDLISRLRAGWDATETTDEERTPVDELAEDMREFDITDAGALTDRLARLRVFWSIDPDRCHGLSDDLKSQALRLTVDRHPAAALVARAVLEIDTWSDVELWLG